MGTGILVCGLNGVGKSTLRICIFPRQIIPQDYCLRTLRKL